MRQKLKVDISLIVTVSQPGYYLQPSLASMQLAVNMAVANNLQVEVIFLLSLCDDISRSIVNNYVIANNYHKVVEVDNDNPFDIRKFGLKMACGEQVAFLEGGDLISANYLINNYEISVNNNFILPEYIIFFTESAHLIETQDCIKDNLLLLGAFVFGSRCLLNQKYKGEFIEFTVNTSKNTVYFSRIQANNRKLEMLIYKSLGPRSIDEINKLEFTSIDNRLILKSDSFKTKLENFNSKIRRRFSQPPKVTVFEVVKPKLLVDNQYQQLISIWQQIHEIEPITYPAAWIFKQYEKCLIPEIYLQNIYQELENQYDDTTTHLFMLPALNIGGSDLVALNYINNLNELGKVVTVITTQNPDSAWLYKLNSGVNVIELVKLFPDLDYERLKHLILKLLLNKTPKVIHNINCLMAYELFMDYGYILKQFSQLFVSIFAYGLALSGRRGGYVVYHLRNVFKDLTCVFTDNMAIIEYCVNTLGLDRAKFATHYQPITIPRISLNDFKFKQNFKVVWASRIAQEKKIDMVLEIVRQCSNLPCSFDVYGSYEDNCKEYIELMKNLANIKYMGSYDDFSRIADQGYDIFLYTSNWDGLPNVLLEAMASGLIVIAPAVGGIGELIKHEANGFLITDNNDVSAYVNVLGKILNNVYDLNEIRQSSISKITMQHSRENFRKNLSEANNYLNNT